MPPDFYYHLEQQQTLQNSRKNESARCMAVADVAGGDRFMLSLLLEEEAVCGWMAGCCTFFFESTGSHHVASTFTASVSSWSESKAQVPLFPVETKSKTNFADKKQITLHHPVSIMSSSVAAEAYLNYTMPGYYHDFEELSVFPNFSSMEAVCTFKEINSFSEFINLFKDRYCQRHSFGFTVFLCLANLLILLFGLLGNSLVIYVVTWRIKMKTASSLFILNLAVADMLVILCCIPATLSANIFTPWIFGEAMCKMVAYAQGVSVFCSVYSLVAISFDRCRAIHQSMGLTPNISTLQALKIILLIWFVGLIITLPWTFVFQQVHLNPDQNESGYNLPYCHETWKTKTHEISYFVLIHVLACFVVPLGLIVVCNVVIWRSVLGLCPNTSDLSSSASCMNLIHRKRKLRVLKMFTGLTFVFFAFWTPLYVIMARVKFFYDDKFSGCPWEQHLISVLIPLAQLLGSCNSCVNPVLYALLNQKFRESFKSIFVCSACRVIEPSTISIVNRDDNSLAAVVASRLPLKDTPV